MTLSVKLTLAAALLVVLSSMGCATTTVAHPSPRTQAVAKCMRAQDAGRPTPPACDLLASDVAALRILSLQAGR